MRRWNDAIVEEDERSNKMEIKKKKVDDGSKKSFVKVPLLYNIYSTDTKKEKEKLRSNKMTQHMSQLFKWQRYKTNVEARINGLIDGFCYS